jgi:beta-galactosidase/beta-glucuronidase
MSRLSSRDFYFITMKHILLFVTLKVIFLSSYAGTPWHMQPVAIQTSWAKDVNPGTVLPDYPRPQMVRKNWQNLNGLWKYAITSWDAERPSRYDGEILVPFPIESALSGVKKALLPTQRLWYKRSIRQPVKKEERVLLHFSAADWKTTVYLNGKVIGSHLGGYQHFSFDITASMKKGENELVVSVYDPTDLGDNPRGKQTLRPRRIRYTAVSGMWQTVWMEVVPAVYITGLKLTPDIDANCLELYAYTNSTSTDYSVEVMSNNFSVIGKPGKLLELSVDRPHLWSPDDPFLYNLTVRLLYKGEVVDTVYSYFGMRKIAVQKDAEGIPRLFLNNKYVYHLGVLDQGYWPEGLYTAPTDSAMKFDIRTIKDMGFNTIRKHIKVEPDRWYYHCDKMGVLVWQDMVDNPTPYSAAEFEYESAASIQQLYNFPSIVVWVLFNEGWGKYDQERLTKWIKTGDPSRIINGHSGANIDVNKPTTIEEMWTGCELVDIHRYPGPGMPPEIPGKAMVLGEWGGLGVSITGHQWNSDHSWAYLDIPQSAFEKQYNYMMQKLARYEKAGLSGSIYTQPYDVESEENGLMTYDRKIIKIPVARLKDMNAAVFRRF